MGLKIETRASVGDNVYLLHNNEVRTGRVNRITITTGTDLIAVHILYTIYLMSNSLTVEANESRVFTSKAELLASL